MDPRTLSPWVTDQGTDTPPLVAENGDGFSDDDDLAEWEIGDPEDPPADLNQWTLPALRAWLTARGCPGISLARKADLIEVVKEYYAQGLQGLVQNSAAASDKVGRFLWIWALWWHCRSACRGLLKLLI